MRFFRGVDSSINLLIEDLSKNLFFIKFTQLSKQKKQELYDQELILRFIAFYDNVEKINSNTETFLDNFMQESVESGNFDTEKYRTLFQRVMKLLDDHCDQFVFRNERKAFVPAMFEAIMIGLAENIEKYESNGELVNISISL